MRWVDDRLKKKKKKSGRMGSTSHNKQDMVPKNIPKKMS